MDQTFKILFLLIPLPILIWMMSVRNKRDGSVGTYSVVIFTCIFYYLAIPLVTIVSDDVNKTRGYTMRIAEASMGQLVLALIAVFLFILFFNITYNRYNTRRKQKIYLFNQKRLVKLCTSLTWMTFVVGGVSFVLYIRAFGGLSRLLEVSEYLRAYSYANTKFVSYYESLLVIPARLITVAPIVSIVLIKEKRKNTFLYFIVFLISFVLALCYHLANAGKAGLLTFILCFVAPIFVKLFKHPWRLVLCCAIIGIPCLGIVDSIFYYLQTGIWRDVATNAGAYVYQFSYPASNVLNLTGIASVEGFRWGIDYITAFLNVLPGVNFSASTEATSFFYVGANWRKAGGTPNDIITFGFLQFGYIGVVLSGIIIGVFCGKMDRLLLRFEGSYGVQVIKCTMIISVFTMLANADLSAIIMNQMHFWVVALCVLLSMSVNIESE